MFKLFVITFRFTKGHRHFRDRDDSQLSIQILVCYLNFFVIFVKTSLCIFKEKDYSSVWPTNKKLGFINSNRQLRYIWQTSPPFTQRAVYEYSIEKMEDRTSLKEDEEEKPVTELLIWVKFMQEVFIWHFELHIQIIKLVNSLNVCFCVSFIKMLNVGLPFSSFPFDRQ